ncbi:MAG: eukaryotic-like serine/threonine-protein kinase [Mycobacterium sp.]|nr:eukaryotic-like serine/threonine-protein kinase [Mycobacterium sp.]
MIGRYREPVEGTPFGRYQLIELLGRGGMGEVWRAHDTTIDRVVALKMLLPHYAQDEDFDKRFRREARTAARLDDPHVVPIYDVGEIDGRLYVTMRLINGVDLDTLLKTGPLKTERAVHIIEQIAGALHSAHQAGLVHRDVKPSNILLADNDFAYLIDFGIARAADDTKLTSEGSTIGTWAYMAPERFNTTGYIEPSSDIYALACVLYQCLTGEPPFPGNTLEQVAVGHMVAPPPRASETSDTVPPGLDRVIETGLAKQTAERYPTAVEMAAAARRAITEPTSQPAAVPTQLNPVSRSSPNWPAPPHPMQSPPGHSPYGVYPYPSTPGQFSAPNLQVPTAPPIPKRKGPRHGVLIGALVFIATLIVLGGVIAIVEVTGHDDSTPTGPTTAAAGGADFTGNYRADLGPGTDLDGKPVPNAPATTSSWAVRSTCGAGGCMATAANISDGGVALLSNLTFDQVGGTWVAVGLASADCGGDKPDELWVVYTLQPAPDGTLTGETIRASTNSACAAKRSVKFTRTGDPDLNKVPDPAVLPPRVSNTADVLRGSYRQTTTFTNGNVVPGKVLTANTYCLRTGDRCMSLFHADGGAVTLMFADDKWTRNEQGTTMCAGGGTAQVTITAEYPMPVQIDDPIALLTGRGSQTVAAGGACTGGGDFEDKFQRTGD